MKKLQKNILKEIKTYKINKKVWIQNQKVHHAKPNLKKVKSFLISIFIISKKAIGR